MSAAAAAAEILSVSSEFDIFELRPIKTSAVAITEVVYKPNATVDQNDLEFLIHSDNDT